uniref:Exportin-7/Ran-binding protein 17 TPR repeats domain-containing protein n=1 Tax=Aegilops tauschii TaxID=37682 RepID=M8CQS6_AEGTA
MQGNYVMNYLAARGPKLQNFVTISLIQLACRITKFGWFDDDRFREIFKEATDFLALASQDHYLIGLKILNFLVMEMNQKLQKFKFEIYGESGSIHPDYSSHRFDGYQSKLVSSPDSLSSVCIEGGTKCCALHNMNKEYKYLRVGANSAMPLTLHRKIATSFKDQFLLQIFQISLTSLHQLKSEVPDELRRVPISLALRCLSFDFVGSPVDESSEEFGTVQLPASWRPLLQDPSTVQIFFDYYKVNDTSVSKEALECLVRLASVRRSLFVEDPARSQFLSHLMSGTREILQTGQGLADHGNYHEFCRLLGRFKVNYQLSELLNVEFYGEWLGLVAEFTTKSLLSWQWASNSVYYLLSLWSRLVTSVPYLKGDTPSLLDETVPKITEGFITSRINSVQASFADNSPDPDNPLENAESLQDQLESLPYLCRFKYESCSLFIINIMEPLLQAYTARSRLPASGDAAELSVIEGQIAWMVHIIAAILKIRQTVGCSQDSQELFDAELAARVLQLINITDTGVHAQRYQEISKQRLDRAILIFVQNFRRSYVGDQAMHASKQLYARLSELLGLTDHLVLLNVIVGKIATNLKCYAECEDVIDHTLSLFQELASGYMTGKLLLKLESTKFIIANHSRENFPFLEEYRCVRSRTNFYYILGCLVFMEDGPVKFRSFMEPLLQVAVNLEASADAAFRTDVVKYAFTGLMRDLRGIAMATNSRRTYGLLFDWLYPSRMPLLLRAISLLTDEPEVTTPLLKFMSEFVLNKAQRLTFDSSSPNGILLFREITLCGNYVNFGVFELYGDRALADALDISLKMTLSIPLSDILTFKKLSKAYYGYMEVLFNNHITINSVLNLDTSTFVHIVTSLESGLKGLDTGISTQCASAIDSLAAFYFNNITAGDNPPSPAALNLARHIGELPSLFPQILKSLFEIIIFEDAGNQWSLSRPILSLIMISEQMFSDLRAQILASQDIFCSLNTVISLELCYDSYTDPSNFLSCVTVINRRVIIDVMGVAANLEFYFKCLEQPSGLRSPA